jgi:hypothetical protein
VNSNFFLILPNAVKLFKPVSIMGSKERIHRLKENTRVNILDAAYDIVKDEGWQALSMRKIADKIEYTAPIIYEYYANKEAILLELTKKGFIAGGADEGSGSEAHGSGRADRSDVAGLLELCL